MGKLQDLPNIGKKLEENLKKAGIATAEELQSTGSKEAFLRLRTIDESACANMLYALEGAVQGIRWHYLADKDKKSLKTFYETMNKKKGTGYFFPNFIKK